MIQEGERSQSISLIGFTELEGKANACAS